MVDRLGVWDNKG